MPQAATPHAKMTITQSGVLLAEVLLRLGSTGERYADPLYLNP